ncbi:hypothetical protein Pla110_18410 [Polystyrenella longa]|uniref:Uncharacterized protein n=1 Tax=Polystyrenella longa TaxID=2528007 RepID=A0A518CLL7_9PLAN|nr:DUF4956 domain-containing protein [Polystyrenella longa]QDU80119.1 hypothetical protein Pla110_18410 [Polystyrenella longa]
MPDWMPSFSEDLNISASTLIVRLLLAWIGGIVVAGIARGGIRQTPGDSLSLTLVLMSILIAMATQIIGDNIARAFSLVGALSIVRFRTAVPATRDVAFVLAAVIVGMAMGAGQYWVSGFGLLTVAIATGLSNRQAGSLQHSKKYTVSGNFKWRLLLQVSLHQADGWSDRVEPLVSGYRLISVNTVRRGSALEMIYDFEPLEGVDATRLISTLNALPGVESVTARQNS